MHPIILKLGHITLYSYGMMVAMAFLFGIYVSKLEAIRKNIKPDLVYDLSFYLIIGGLIGARLYYVAFFNPQSFIKDPISIFKLWQGGLSIHGGILAGIIAGFIFSKIKKVSFWRLADIISPAIILGQGIGRIGCFLNGCCFGLPIKSFPGIRFPKGSLPDIAYNGLPVHPAQLYELILNLAGFFILWSFRKRLKFDGGLFLLYLMMYAIIRPIVSQFRGDDVYIWHTNLKAANVVSIIIFIIALAVFIKRKNA